MFGRGIAFEFGRCGGIISRRLVISGSGIGRNFGGLFRERWLFEVR